MSNSIDEDAKMQSLLSKPIAKRPRANVLFMLVSLLRKIRRRAAEQPTATGGLINFGLTC